MSGGKSVQEQIQNLQSVYLEFQQLNTKVENQYNEEVNKSQQTQKKYQQLNTQKDFLSNQIVAILQNINHQFKRSIKKKTDQLQIVKSKLQQKNKNAQLISQNQYFYKVPQCRFDLKNIDVPDGINDVVEQFHNQFLHQKSTLQNQITKLKILIKLAQMNKDESNTKPSKGRKNQ